VNLADTGTGPRSDAGQSDEAFKRSIESLSRLLASRPVPPPPSPETEFFAPRDEAAVFRRRSMPAVLLLVAAIAAVSAGVYSFLRGAAPPQESHKTETIPAATVSPPPAALPAPSIPTVAPSPVDTAPVSSTDFVPPKPIVVSQPLDAHGISELQTRLGRLGFSPGPVDGVAGPMTVAAIKRYQQSRGRPLTTAVDDDLLDQLRKEPAP